MFKHRVVISLNTGRVASMRDDAVAAALSDSKRAVKGRHEDARDTRDATGAGQPEPSLAKVAP